MSKLISKFFKLFEKPNYGSELEAYIVGKNPSNAAEVDHYAREYQNRNLRGL